MKINEKIRTYFIIIYLLIMSGSVLQNLYMESLQKINIIITCFLVFVEISKNKRFFCEIPKNALSIFLIVAIVSSCINIIIWQDLGSIAGYLANISLLIVALIVAYKIDYLIFVECFVEIMLFLAIISLLFYYIPVISEILPSIHLKNTASYNGYMFYGIYAKYANAFYYTYKRNIGVFWEPGMYQGYLIFAMVLLSQNKKGRWDFVKFLLLAVAVISTGSTTGLILLLPVIYLFVMSYVEKHRTIYVVLSVIMVGLLVMLLVFGQDVDTLMRLMFPTDVTTKLMDVNNISRNTRLYNIISDIKIIFSNPLGVANSQISSLREISMSSFGRNVDASVTNSSLTMCLLYGIVSGILYLWITVKGSLGIAKSYVSGIVVTLIVLIIINTEPHYLGIYFTAMMFSSFLQKEQTVRDGAVIYYEEV